MAETTAYPDMGEISHVNMAARQADETTAWEPVTTGLSGATITKRGGTYRKTSPDPAADLPGEAARLTWLRANGIPAARVLTAKPGLLETAAVPGLTAADPWPPELLGSVVDALADLARALHALPIADCLFDRRLATTIPLALARTDDIDLADLDDAHKGRTRAELVAELLATRPAEADEDLVVCHGDLCLPNVVFDAATGGVNGVVDAGRVGVADRWADLALVTRSLADARNEQYGEWAVERFLASYGAVVDERKREFYRLLDEFF